MRVLDGEKLVTAGDLSADFKSPVISYQHLWVASIQLRWSGTPTGTFKLQISNVGTPTDDTVWVDVDTQAAGGAVGKKFWNFSENMAGKYLRVVYVFGSGTGSVDLWAEGKGV